MRGLGDGDLIARQISTDEYLMIDYGCSPPKVRRIDLPDKLPRVNQVSKKGNTQTFEAGVCWQLNYRSSGEASCKQFSSVGHHQESAKR